MPDYFNWVGQRLDAETLYFYCTLMRLGYQRNNQLWEFLGLLDGLVDEVLISPAVGANDINFTMVKGPTGGAIVANGTENWSQRIHQFTLVKQVQDDSYPGMVSEFYRDRLNEIFNSMVRFLERIPVGGLTACGHSMGGAVAQLAGHIIRRRSPSRFQGCITAGSVRVGSPAFADGTQFLLVRLENVGDPIPLWPLGMTIREDARGERFAPLPIQEYRHAGQQWLIGHDGSIVITKGADARGLYPPPRKMLRRTDVPDPFLNHFIRDYSRRLRSRIAHSLSVGAMLGNRRLHVLDAINIALNDLDGDDWKLDPETGLPTASLISPNAAVPSPGINVNAPDP